MVVDNAVQLVEAESSIVLPMHVVSKLLVEGHKLLQASVQSQVRILAPNITLKQNLFALQLLQFSIIDQFFI